MIIIEEEKTHPFLREELFSPQIVFLFCEIAGLSICIQKMFVKNIKLQKSCHNLEMLKKNTIIIELGGEEINHIMVNLIVMAVMYMGSYLD